jgi:hypothetical protein
MPIDSLSVHLDVFTRKPMVLLLFVILLALIPRLLLLPVSGHNNDLCSHQIISQYIAEHGLFKLYDDPINVNHPPIGVALYAGSSLLWHTLTGNDIQAPCDPENGGRIAALKYPGVIFELALIALIFEIMLRKANVKWAVSTALLFAFSPGNLLTVSGTGQTESIYAFFLLLALVLLKGQHTRWAWVAYALAWLSKFQSIMLLPIIVVWTWRRSGVRALILNLLVFILIISAVMTPFVINSKGNALNPYNRGSVDQWPFITNAAYNLWYWVTNAVPTTRDLDSAELVWGLSYFQVGLLLYALATALICLRVWLLPDRDDEFLVAATAGIAFFMLPTQIHTRYIYIGLLFLVLALQQAPILSPIYIGFALNFGHDVRQTMSYKPFPGALDGWDTTLNAIANMLFFAVLLGYTLWPLVTVRHEAIRRIRASVHLKDLAGVSVLLIFAVFMLSTEELFPRKIADPIPSLNHWLDILPQEGQILTPEGSFLAAEKSESDSRWLAANVTAQTPDQWVARGVDYLALTDSDLETADLAVYVSDLSLLKRIAPEPTGPHSITIFRMQPPSIITDIVFNNQIHLVGYDLDVNSNQSVFFRPYWHATSRPPRDYSLFVHLLPLDDDQIIVQADVIPGENNRVTSSWNDSTEFIVGTGVTLSLPDELRPGTYRLNIGVYDWQTGERLLTNTGDQYWTLMITLGE